MKSAPPTMPTRRLPGTGARRGRRPRQREGWGGGVLRGRDFFVRRSEAPEEAETVGFESLSLFDLLSALRYVLERFPEERIHEVTLDTISVREKMSFLLDELRRRGKVIFQSLFETATSRLEVAVI